MTNMKKLSNTQFINCVIEEVKQGIYTIDSINECSHRLTLASVKKSASMSAMLDGLFDILSNKTDLSFLVKDGKKC